MTTLFIHRGTIYTDTNHYLGKEKLQSLSKVKAFEEPVTIRWTHGTLFEKISRLNQGIAAFEDKVHGYTVSGFNPSANSFIECMTSPTEGFEDAVGRVLIACESGFINDANYFGIVLFGEKNIYSLTSKKEDTDILEVHPLDAILGFGSGADTVLKSILIHKNPLRAMVETLVYDDLSDGLIDIWRIPRLGEPYMERIGLFNQRSKGEYMELLHGRKAVLPDLIPLSMVDDMVEDKLRKDRLDNPNKHRYKPSRPRKTPR